MKKLLVLNGSHSDIPLIRAGRALGFRVITTGVDPSLIGHREAHEYHYADFSDKEAVLALARYLRIDAICSCANDFGAITAAYVAEQMGLGGHDPYETALTLHHKDRYRTLAQQHGFLSPPAACYDTVEAALAVPPQLPLIIKPIDLTGGKGVTRVEQEKDYDSAVRHAFDLSRSKRIVVEDFIRGTYHSLTTFLRDGKVVFHFSDDELSYKNSFLVSTSAAPATDFHRAKDILITTANKVAARLKLVDGVFHLQYIMRDDEAFIIEVTRRCSGDLYPLPVQRATGVDWAEWIVRAEAGMGTADFPQATQQGFVGRHCIMAARDGVVKEVRIAPELEGNIFERMEWWKPGDTIQHCMVQKLGILMLAYDSEAEMRDKTARINQLVQVVFG